MYQGTTSVVPQGNLFEIVILSGAAHLCAAESKDLRFARSAMNLQNGLTVDAESWAAAEVMSHPLRGNDPASLARRKKIA